MAYMRLSDVKDTVKRRLREFASKDEVIEIWTRLTPEGEAVVNVVLRETTPDILTSKELKYRRLFDDKPQYVINAVNKSTYQRKPDETMFFSRGRWLK